MAVTWLHISDFHFKTGDPYDRDVVLRALLESIRRFHQQGRRVDLIFATGDIAYSGKEAEYALAGKFFDDVLAATGLTRDRLFVVPGNHDVDRDEGEFLQRTLESREAADKYFRPNQTPPHFKKFAAYHEWYDTYFKDIRTFPTNTTCASLQCLAINRHDLEILSINSALFAQDNSDHGKLWVGRRCLDAALPERTPGNRTIRMALLHHPVDWLHEVESANIDKKLINNFDVILRGHLHKTDLKRIATESESVLQFAAGAAYQTREHPNKAMYCTVSDGFVEIFPIRYEDEPNETWTLDTSVFPDKAPTYIGRFKLPKFKPDTVIDTATVTSTPTPTIPSAPEKSDDSKHKHTDPDDIASRLTVQLKKSIARVVNDATLHNDPFLRKWTELNPDVPLPEIFAFCTTFDPNRILLKIGHAVKAANALADDGFLSAHKPWGAILDLAVNMSLVACARWIQSEPIGQLHLIDELPSVGMYDEFAAAIVAATWLNFELAIQINVSVHPPPLDVPS